MAALESQAALGLFTRETIEPVLLGALGGHPHVTDVTLTLRQAIGTYDPMPLHDAGDLRLAPASARATFGIAGGGNGTARFRTAMRPIGDGWERSGGDRPRRPTGDRVRGDRRDDPRSLPRSIRRSLPRFIRRSLPDRSQFSNAPATIPRFIRRSPCPPVPEFRGRALWSDLAFFEPDARPPERPSAAAS